MSDGIWTLIHAVGDIAGTEEVFIGAISPELIGWFCESVCAAGATPGSRQHMKRSQWYAVFSGSHREEVFSELRKRGFVIVTHEFVKP